MSKTYRVEWVIDIDAESALDAARQAREIQLRDESLAVVFSVWTENADCQTIDLAEESAK